MQIGTRCNDFPAVANGNVSYSLPPAAPLLRPHGTEANFTCDPDYILSRTVDSIQCMDGVWTGNATCDPIIIPGEGDLEYKVISVCMNTCTKIKKQLINY